MVILKVKTKKTTPKKKKDNTIILQNTWYNYYAGYSDSFIIKYLKKYSRGFSNPLILDPWAGSGTTNVVANYLGYKNIGIDINPVMIVVSKAKYYDCLSLDCEELSRVLSAEKLSYYNYTISKDYLVHWFDDDTVAMIRSFEALMQDALLSFKNRCSLNDINISEINNKTAFFYLLLFNTIKKFSKDLTKSNPTWVRTKNIKDKISIDAKRFVEEYIRCAFETKKHYIAMTNVSSFILSNSVELPLKNDCIDIVLTSPPYCTRIDYAISTILELSVMGYSEDDITNLRKLMIGTPKILSDGDQHDIASIFPPKTKYVLNRIKAHKSKAAKSYYYKTYYQYFLGMNKSIYEINRVTKHGGIVMLIVQDSYFKDVFINLKQCLVEMFEQYDFTLLEAKAFKATNNIRAINTNSRKYKDTVKVYERVIVLKKE